MDSLVLVPFAKLILILNLDVDLQIALIFWVLIMINLMKSDIKAIMDLIVQSGSYKIANQISDL
jgi:hypothetical protein